MLTWIKLRVDSSIKEVDGKHFITSGVENAVNCKIIPLPNDLEILSYIKELKNEFVQFKECKAKFSTDANRLFLFKHLCLNYLFVYKTASDSPYTFCPKFTSDYLVNGELPLNLDHEGSHHAYLKKEDKRWIIDSPTSPFFVRLDDKEVSVESLPSEFMSFFKLGMFKGPNEIIDFKDQLFLHEIRRRGDRPKGTSPKNVEVSSDRLKSLFSKDDLELNLNQIPNIYRRNSSRGAGKLTYEELKSLIENVFSKQASMDDQFLGIINKRYYPAAGCGYELTPVVFVKDVVGVEPGAYYLDTDSSSLIKLNLPASKIKKIYESSKNSWGKDYGYPPAVIQLIFNPLFYYRKYSQICLSLSMLNAGVIFSEIYRAAHQLEIGVCAVGSTSEDIWFDETGGQFMGVAEIAITGLKK